MQFDSHEQYQNVYRYQYSVCRTKMRKNRQYTNILNIISCTLIVHFRFYLSLQFMIKNHEFIIWLLLLCNGTDIMKFPIYWTNNLVRSFVAEWVFKKKKKLLDFHFYLNFLRIDTQNTIGVMFSFRKIL